MMESNVAAEIELETSVVDQIINKFHTEHP